MARAAWRTAAVIVVGGCSLTSCGTEPPASLSANVAVVSTDGACTPEVAGSVCRVTKVLTVSLQESAGRDVALQSVSGILFDTRGMQDMHATPVELSATDIRVAAGSSMVPARGELTVPYTLTFEFVEPAIVGPIKAIVQARGRDSGGNAVEASAEAF